MASIRLASALLAASLLACAEDPDLAVQDEALTNGAPAGNAFPEVGYLGLDGPWCTGTLIGPRTFLTAAHCAAHYYPQDLRVTLAGVTYTVARSVRYPSWVSGREEDLAVMTLERVAPLTPLPIDHGNLAAVGDRVTMVGYGRTALGNPIDGVKRWGTNDIDRIDPLTYVSFNETGNEAMGCGGDSGGPVLRSDRVIGVHRARSGDCFDGGSLHVRVWPFRGWIEDQMVYPFVDVPAMVTQQYRDFLGREPDTAGRFHWSQRVRTGELEPEGVVAGFLRTPEFAGTSAPIIRLYLAAFGRLPDSGGFYHWLGQVRAGVAMGTIADQFGGTTEFRNRYGALSNDQFVKQAYRNTLGRDPDPSGFSYWTGRLNAGSISRAGVLDALAQSDEAAARFVIDVDVSMVYLGMLRRSPDATGFHYWKGEMQAGRMTTERLVHSVLHGGEYARRFGGI